jgi:hypothetical protein
MRLSNGLRLCRCALWSDPSVAAAVYRAINIRLVDSYKTDGTGCANAIV